MKCWGYICWLLYFSLEPFRLVPSTSSTFRAAPAYEVWKQKGADAQNCSRACFVLKRAQRRTRAITLSYDVQNVFPPKNTPQEITKFFVDYIQNDNLGKIANAHLVWADRSNDLGARCQQCLQLAALHSKAVDFPKSGVPAKFPEVLTRHMPSGSGGRCITLGGAAAVTLACEHRHFL